MSKSGSKEERLSRRGIRRKVIKKERAVKLLSGGKASAEEKGPARPEAGTDGCSKEARKKGRRPFQDLWSEERLTGPRCRAKGKKTLLETRRSAAGEGRGAKGGRRSVPGGGRYTRGPWAAGGKMNNRGRARLAASG